MRIFVIADIHGNLPALESVLADMQRFQPRFVPEHPQGDRLICLGDVIGYYSFPNEIMDRLWDMECEILIGNHEQNVYEAMISPDDQVWQWGMNPQAVWAFRWTAENLRPENRQRLRRLMEVRNYVLEDLPHRILFTHAAPAMPEMMPYIANAEDAWWQFFRQPDLQFFRLAVVGHLHVPQYYCCRMGDIEDSELIQGGRVVFRGPEPPMQTTDSMPPELHEMLVCERSGNGYEKTWTMPACDRMLVSVPSVGQPRDGLPYAGYAVIEPDARQLTMVRLPYDIERMVTAMKGLPGCPEILIQRLMVGR